ncbi:MAG: ECF transporter S component [Clostridia bacterium]|nr:ECF transporter S component [Clostridia bacterium]
MARKLSSQHERIFKLCMLGILTALVIVLQSTGTAIKFLPGGTSVSLTLIPIVMGAMILGPGGGLWLGFMFGLITVIMGASGADWFTNTLFVNHSFLTILTCMSKAMGAGLLSGLVYRALMKKNALLATFTAAAVAPITNTGLFILGALTMSDTLTTQIISDGSTVMYYLIIICAGLNFVFEFILNMVVAPALNIVMMHLGLVPKGEK